MLTSQQPIDWSDVEFAADELAGNWQDFGDNFTWDRRHYLHDADCWCICYTSHRDSGLATRSNERCINKRLKPFSRGDDPDLVFETHSHWLAGHKDGFSVRVFSADSSITPAFKELCRIKEALQESSLLDETDYSTRVYAATLENYSDEAWRFKDELPQGWQEQVYSWFSDHGEERYIENTDGRGGWAPREAIIKALQDLGLLLEDGWKS